MENDRASPIESERPSGNGRGRASETASGACSCLGSYSCPCRHEESGIEKASPSCQTTCFPPCGESASGCGDLCQNGEASGFLRANVHAQAEAKANRPRPPKRHKRDFTPPPELTCPSTRPARVFSPLLRRGPTSQIQSPTPKSIFVPIHARLQVQPSQCPRPQANSA